MGPLEPQLGEQGMLQVGGAGEAQAGRCEITETAIQAGIEVRVAFTANGLKSASTANCLLSLHSTISCNSTYAPKTGHS